MLAEANTTLRAEITARQLAVKALSRSQQQYAALVNSVNGIVWEADMQTQRFSFVGQQAERLLGYPLERWLRESDFWSEHMHPDDREWVFAFCEKAMWEQPAFQLRYRMLTAEGRTVWLQDCVNVIVENDQRVKLRGVIVDISPQKQAEAILHEAKEAAEAANRVKSEFLATMSHELRTPLSVIIGYVDLFVEGTFGPLTEKAEGCLQRIRNRAVELLELIVAMLDLSRLEEGRLPMQITEGRIPELLEELQAETQELKEATKLEFAWKVDTKLPPLYTDLGKLKTVIKNLIGNAVKFTDQGRITIAAHNREGGVEIAVTDTGIGIPQAELVVIFEPFRQVDNSPTRQHGGTGLGLHIVKRLLELLDGRVSVESEVGRGTTFRVWIPAGR